MHVDRGAFASGQHSREADIHTADEQHKPEYTASDAVLHGATL